METQQWQVSRVILIFEKIFFDNRFINLGVSWNCVESVFWHARDIPYLPLLQNVLILCRKNNTNEDPSYDIVPNVSISSETCLDWVSKKYSKLRNIAKLFNAAVVGIIESKLDNSVLSSEYALIITIHLCNFNYIISCVFFSIWLWWRAVSKYGTFFMRVFSSLPDVHVLEVFLEPMVSNTELEIAKRDLLVILNHYFIVFNNHSL